MKITAHCLARNEARFIWYSVMSVIKYVDHMLLWDNGSSDQTGQIIYSLANEFPSKISTRLMEPVIPGGFPQVRQQMLDATTTDWFLVVDADEIWFADSIKRVVKTIRKEGGNLESIVVPTINLVGDMFHYQEDRAGNYQLVGRQGNLALRAVNMKLPGLSSSNPHGTWGWVDGRGDMIQNRNPAKIKYIYAPYLHATFLPRAGTRAADISVPKRERKYKLELGLPFARDFYYPESFFLTRPGIVPSPWQPFNTSYKNKALLATPLKRLRRRLIKPPVGY